MTKQFAQDPPCPECEKITLEDLHPQVRELAPKMFAVLVAMSDRLYEAERAQQAAQTKEPTID